MTLKKQNPPSASFKKALSTQSKQFCQHCTLHGVYYLYSSERWWVQLTWSGILAASLALCAFLSHMIWSKFVLDPTFTVVESTRYSTQNIPFPAAAICDTEVVYYPNTDNITSVLNLRGYNSSQIDDFYKSFSEVQNKDYKPEEYVPKMHAVLQDLGFTYDVLLDQLKKPCEVILKQCVWRSKVIDCANMFRQVFTLVGFCCQFDLSYFRHHAKKDTNFASGIEITEGLDVIVNSRRSSAVNTSNDGYLLLYVFDKLENVTLLDGSITITPATYFDVTTEVWSIDSSDEVRALALRSRKCLFNTDPDVNGHSYQDCMTRLILKKVVEFCRCLPFRYLSNELNVEEFYPCPWQRLSCIYQTLERVQSDIRSMISEDECYQKCEYVQYETQAEYVRQERDIGNNSEGYSRVTIHFAEDTCMKYRREVLYTWDQMLANLGGIFGLCLGGSIISIIEMLWFILETLFSMAGVAQKKIYKRKIGKRNLKNKNFVTKVSPERMDVIGVHRFVN